MQKMDPESAIQESGRSSQHIVRNLTQPSNNIIFKHKALCCDTDKGLCRCEPYYHFVHAREESRTNAIFLKVVRNFLIPV